MLNNLLLFQDSSTRMDWLAQRQKVLSENIANVDTPEFKARDLREQRWNPNFPWDPFAFKLQRTSNDHYASLSERRGTFRDERTRTNVEVTISDNNVVLENEISRMSESALNYRLTTQMFRKYSNMHTLALGSNSN